LCYALCCKSVGAGNEYVPDMVNVPFSTAFFIKGLSLLSLKVVFLDSKDGKSLILLNVIFKDF
jgi:hypothetical protein